MLKKILLPLATLMASLLPVCTLAVPVHAQSPLQVSVSLAPQKYFVEKVGGGLVRVAVMVEPGSNPHVYEPKPRQMVEIARSRLYFATGDSFEQVWLERLSAANPNMAIVRMDGGIEKLPMEPHGHEGEHRKEKGGHDHHGGEQQEGIRDPHIWLSPPLAMLQARNVLAALVDTDPDNRSTYEENYKNFMAELVELDIELKNIFLATTGREFMVFHPAWGYFARAYGLRQLPVQIEGKEPKAGELKRLIEYARERNIRVVFVQPQFSTSSAKVLADAIQGEIVFADPLAVDWAGNLREVGEKFKAALR